MFAALAQRDNAALPPLPAGLDFHTLRNWLETTRNDLEPPARAIEPAIGEALAALDRPERGFARMSGSGATCFGLFETGNVAKRAAAAIRGRQPGWFVAATRSMASEADAWPGLTKAAPFIPVGIAVLTVSDTRTLADDKSGQTLADRIAEAGHMLADRAIVTDDKRDDPRPGAGLVAGRQRSTW